MYKFAILFSIILLFPISANCASAAGENGVTIEAPKRGVSGGKIQLKVQTVEPLPSSSFYRVEVECPDKPEGSKVSGEMGYPLSELIFDGPGRYTCQASLGILTKSSCAGARYRPLGEREFTIEITSGGDK